MGNGFESLNQDDVVSVKPDTFNNLDVSKTFKVLDLIVAIREYVGADGTDEENLYYGKGLNSEVLKLGAKGWQKGKLRIKFTLEFCSDEPEVEQITQSNEPEINQTESPLDDIRRMMNKDN